MTSPDDLNPADLEQLLEELVASEGVRVASVDPANVNALPGCWARVDELRFEQLSGLTIALTLHVIVAEQDFPRALRTLAAAFNKIKPVLSEHGGGPTGPVRLVRVALQGSQTALPALAVPFDLSTTQE